MIFYFSPSVMILINVVKIWKGAKSLSCDDHRVLQHCGPYHNIFEVSSSVLVFYEILCMNLMKAQVHICRMLLTSWVLAWWTDDMFTVCVIPVADIWHLLCSWQETSQETTQNAFCTHTLRGCLQRPWSPLSLMLFIVLQIVPPFHPCWIWNINSCTFYSYRFPKGH